METSKSFIVTAIIVALGLIVLFTTCGYQRIDAGHAGVLVELYGSDKGVQNVTAVTGGNFYNKWTEEIHEFPTYVQHKVWTKDANEDKAINEEFAVTTKDGMTFTFDVGFDYQVIPERVPHIFSKYRKDLSDITDEFLRTAVRNSYNETAGQYDADTLLFKRNKFEATAKALLVSKLKEDFAIVQLGIVGKVRMPPAFEKAINDKIQATQEAQTVENQKRTVIAEAQKQIAKARGDSTSLMINTHANNMAQRANADAESYSNQKISSSITSTLIEWQKANSWDGKLPVYSGAGSPILSMPK